MTLDLLVDNMVADAERIYAKIGDVGPRIHGSLNQSPRSAAKSVLVNLRQLQKMCHGWEAVPEQGVMGCPPEPALAELEV